MIRPSDEVHSASCRMRQAGSLRSPCWNLLTLTSENDNCYQLLIKVRDDETSSPALETSALPGSRHARQASYSPRSALISAA